MFEELTLFCRFLWFASLLTINSFQFHRARNVCGIDIESTFIVMILSETHTHTTRSLVSEIQNSGIVLTIAIADEFSRLSHQNSFKSHQKHGKCEK